MGIVDRKLWLTIDNIDDSDIKVNLEYLFTNSVHVSRWVAEVIFVV